MSVRKLILTTLASLYALAGGLVFSGAPAQAAIIHPFLSSFSPGVFSNPQGIAVEQAGGTVYVYDAGSGSVYKFDAAGEPAEFSALKSDAIVGVGGAGNDENEIAVDNVNGDIYVANGRHIGIYASDGTSLGELNEEVEGVGGPWGEPCGVAVDPAGNVYVGLYPSHVNKYTPTVGSDPVTNNDYTSSIEGVDQICNIAADSEGDVYVDTWREGPVSKYDALQFGTLAASGTQIDGGGSTLAVDPSTNDVYIDEGSHIAQFDAAGSLIGRFPRAGDEGAFSGSYGVAVRSSSGDMYVIDGANDRVDVFGPNEVVPDVTTEAASGLTATGGTLNGTVNADKTSVTACDFEYGTEEGVYPHTIACTKATPFSGEAPVAVSANVSGLEQGVLYHYRLVATNANGTSQGSDETLFTPFPVTVSEESVLNVASSSATLAAQINPGGGDTTYHFEYGTSASYGSNVPVPDGDAGSGLSATSTSYHLQGLEPDTTYHFRILAANPLGAVEGPDQTFTTQSSGGEFGLPDGRAYELVSPPNKDGAEVDGSSEYDGFGGVVQASEEGSAITYLTNAPVGADQRGNTSGSQVLSTRGSGGWSSQDITTPHTTASGYGVGHGEEYRLFSPDLSLGLVEPEGTTPLAPQAPPNERNLYRWDAGNGSYEPLVTSPPRLPFTASGLELVVVGAASDLSHVVFASYQALTANALDAKGYDPNLYEWAGGKLQLVNVLPEAEGGTPTAGEAGLGEFNSENTRHAVSNDGSRVIWTGGGNDGKIYVRDMIKGKTILAGRGQFATASSDGSRVFFIDGGGLDEFDVNSGKLIELTAGNAEVQGVLGASEDGSYVYFVARGALAGGPGNGANNLYLLRDDGTSWTTTFIASLAGEDTPDWGEITPGLDLADVTSQVSPDGRYVAFMSSASLTGYDNRDAVSGASDVEVYLYDSADAGRLVCASCNPSGARPVGESDERGGGVHEPVPMDIFGSWKGQWLAAAVRGWTRVDTERALYQSRDLSDSGRLFFDSSDALVPHDSNGREDVYEYEPGGVGSCQSAGGCVSLISPGTGSTDSVFMDASSSGDDVFFITRSRLVPQDFDDSYDLYDAHVCTVSEPCSAAPPASPPPCTTGDACKPAPSPQPPVFGAPSSATFTGAGNLTSPTPVQTVKAKKAKRKTKPKAKHHKHRRAKRSRSNRSLTGGVRR